MVPVGYSSKLEHNTSMPRMSVTPFISVLILSSSFVVHKLITYSFHHKTVTQLLLRIGVLVLLCGGIDFSVDAVWVLMFQFLSISTGVLYTILGLVLFGASAQNQVEGLVPVSLSHMGMATVYSLMVKGFLFGVSVPMLGLKWLFLVIVTLLVPHTVFLCNPIIAGGDLYPYSNLIVVENNHDTLHYVTSLSVVSSVVKCCSGETYGKGWHSLLDMSDARASVLDKKMPFRLLRDNFGFRKSFLPSPSLRSSFLQPTGYRDHTKDI
ncbi:rhomboid domain-containing protein 2-like [Salvelinus alpinus]|uniref:rhomboid domain-containing protein 2-like n=1 Tax=Salvelinus alpinus TaxID=8036 RepID=UPI0039FCBA47